MPRVLAIDYGTVRIGLAQSDPLGILASPLETLRWNGRDDSYVLEYIAKLCAEGDIAEILIGKPLRTDGRSSELAQAAQDFGRRLAERTGLPLRSWDERYSSVLANRALNQMGVKAPQKRQMVDQVAAQIILQEYLDQRRG